MINTYPQFILFIILFLFGFASGIFIGLISAINILFGNKKWLQIILDIVSLLSITIIYLAVINLLNWGEHRLFLATSYIFGIFIERKTIGKIFAKLYYKLYNLIVLKLRIVSQSKIGTFLKR